ncbi:hypothetical protein TSUD_365000 [Trifolium subterraneum]|uniref:Reverse transcriptase domain-containing protein n=1 Tax=Trifolium subterraneum TaxID=3900 RepID=A0A2Z6MLD0_TRISU|nr:hypothetical protein TSUD_365000 [Trifolium subterraneum]
MQAMVEHQFFSGYSFGVQNPIFVSHLQFADDTLLLGTKSWANVRALRTVLVLFETMLGLKVNFNKSILVEVVIRSDTFGFLGIGVDSYTKSLVRVEKSFSVIRWSVSSSKVCVDIFACLCPFLLQSSRRKTSWVSWETICERKEHGGLGVRRLRELIIALIGKWCWDDAGGQRGIMVYSDGGSRLFDLMVYKSSTMVEFSSLGWGTGGGAWVWRRQLWAWEKQMLGECQTLLHDYFLQTQTLDMWLWRSDPVRGYSVQGAYYLLTSYPFDPLV